MLHLVLRQRRRIAFALVMAQLASLLLWPGIVMASILTIAALSACLIVIIAAHDLRRFIECGAVGFYLSALVPLNLMLPIFILATAAIYWVVYSDALDRLPLRITLHSRKKFSVALNRRATWEKIVPGESHPAAFWTGTLMTITPDEDDENTLYLMFKNQGKRYDEVTLTFIDLNPYTSASYLMERDSQIAGEEVIMAYTFAKAGAERTTILSDMRVSGLPISVALARWFDDVLGDELDSFAKMSECRRKWNFSKPVNGGLTSEIGCGTGIGHASPIGGLLDQFDTEDQAAA